jgi:hypothetical protein
MHAIPLNSVVVDPCATKTEESQINEAESSEYQSTVPSSFDMV